MGDWPVRVLLIEDNPEDASLFQELLTEEKDFVFIVEWVDSLRKGLDRLSRPGIDVVISDLTLPDSRGLDTFLAIHGGAKSVPVVLLTGLSDSEIAIEAMRKGAQDYVEKGCVNGRALSRIIRYAIERHRGKEVLRKQAQIIDEIHDAVVCTDLAGVITSWNKGAERLFGFWAEEVIGQHVSMLHPEGSAEFVEHEIIGVLKQKGIHAMETRMRKKSGEEFYAHLSLGLLKDGGGSATGMAGYALDISDRKRAERLKDEFVSIVSHELRGPMLIIRESVSQMADGLAGTVNDRQKEFLNMNISAIDRLSRLIDDLLDISKIEAGRIVLNPRDFDVTGLAHEVRVLFNAESGKRGLFVTVVPPEREIKVHADRDRIFQVFENLVRNAFKFTEKGGVTISAVEKDDAVHLAVSDTGRGIAGEYLGRVFEKFGQFADPVVSSEKGTGLGLAICRAIVEAHGGRIWAESEPCKGTTIRFTLLKAAR